MTRRDVPSVVIVTELFADLARATLRGRGVPNHPLIVLPGNPEFDSGSEVTLLLDSVLSEIARHLAPASADRPVQPA